MGTGIALGASVRGTLNRASALALPVAPYFAVLAAISLLVRGGVLMLGVEGLAAQTPYVLSTILWLIVAARTYQLGLGRTDDANLFSGSIRLGLATSLILFLFSMVIFIIGLFLVIFSGILLATVDFDPEKAETDPAEFARAAGELATSAGGVILVLLIIAAVLGIGWIAARLVLFGVKTIEVDRVRVLQTWDQTRGNGWKILALGTLLVALPYLLAALGSLGVYSFFGGPTLTADLSAQAVYWIVAFPAFLISHAFALHVHGSVTEYAVDVENAFG
ncbi:MAG: hypothetical protein AAGK23_12010 [Pseudomonadota bacterium]